MVSLVAMTRDSVSRRLTCPDSGAISWQPASPREGALFRVRVSGVPSDVQLAGDAAGEPLHFTTAPGEPSIAESFAAVPIDAGDSLGITVRCTVGDRTDTLVTRFAPARANYPVERLRVAPAFGRPPDSALAARVRRESDRAAEVAARSHETPRLSSQPFLRPRPSRITSGFGRGREYNGAITSRHMGTDFAGATGAPVRATNRGVVRIVDAFYYGGNVVYLDHGAGLTSAYLHLSRSGWLPVIRSSAARSSARSARRAGSPVHTCTSSFDTAASPSTRCHCSPWPGTRRRRGPGRRRISPRNTFVASACGRCSLCAKWPCSQVRWRVFAAGGSADGSGLQARRLWLGLAVPFAMPAQHRASRWECQVPSRLNTSPHLRTGPLSGPEHSNVHSVLWKARDHMSIGRDQRHG